MNTAIQIIIGALLFVAAVFLVIAVLMQEGKSHRLSGAIAGGADTIFGKTKGKKVSDTLSRVTSVVSIVFVVIVVVLAIFNREVVLPSAGVDDPITTPVSSVASPSEDTAGTENGTPAQSATPVESENPETPTPETPTPDGN